VASKVGETLRTAYVTSLVEAQRGTFVLALGRRPRGQCRSWRSGKGREERPGRPGQEGHTQESGQEGPYAQEDPWQQEAKGQARHMGHKGQNPWTHFRVGHALTTGGCWGRRRYQTLRTWHGPSRPVEVRREDVKQGQPSRARLLGSLATPMEEVGKEETIWVHLALKVGTRWGYPYGGHTSSVEIFFVGTHWFQKGNFWKNSLSPFRGRWGRWGQTTSKLKIMKILNEKWAIAWLSGQTLKITGF
jgi:hypothetical protein